MTQWMTATVMVSLMMSEAVKNMLMAKLPGLRRYKEQIKPEVSYTELAVLASLKHVDKEQVNEDEEVDETVKALAVILVSTLSTDDAMLHC